MFGDMDKKMGAIKGVMNSLDGESDVEVDFMSVEGLSPEEAEMLKKALGVFRETDGKEPTFTGPSQDPDRVVGEDEETGGDSEAQPDSFGRPPDEAGKDSAKDDDEDDKKAFGRGRATTGG